MEDTERAKILICIKASDHIYRTLNPRAIFDFSLDAFSVSYSSVMADNSRESLSLQWFVLWKSENVSPGKMPREKREIEREWKKGWAIYFPFRVTFFGPELIQKEMAATKTDTDNFLCYSVCLCVQMCRARSLVDRAQEILMYSSCLSCLSCWSYSHFPLHSVYTRLGEWLNTNVIPLR